ncbi:lipopolysaccharide transport periplasmic protein LptA [Sinirhodobacter huangdaonensis]|uniref:Lipopolysaccharide transport periplasmic protein LptA n=1 Tax=Paenirhodobacter huangdaonensis TaxID=2501515 RepID=A0A3S3PG44_9RHOB|nr:lipopolysaccharide transport periplasmic protein LptA [Sinirhodobacter huangdaonensis]RWR52643.1 lipopolysaccharide transport periplasmic protein LptA [Sinirhodobacter huangdaonensis]
MRFSAVPAVLLCLAFLPGPVLAQQIALGGIRADAKAPVEVTADSLAVNQTDGSATFTGNVLVVQGGMRLKAAVVDVEYDPKDRSKITRMHATGGVTLVSPAEAAEAKEAVYDVAASNVVMTGDVLLTQGQNVMSGQKLTVDLKTGTGQIDGRVRTILQPEAKK